MHRNWLNYGVAVLTALTLGCVPEGGKSGDGDGDGAGGGGASSAEGGSRGGEMSQGGAPAAGAMAAGGSSGGGSMGFGGATAAGGAVAGGEMGGMDPNGPSATVVIDTSLGQIVLSLDSERAADTVANFLRYVDDGFYDGDDGAGATIFHRVIPGFMIQGGGFTVNGQQKATYPPVAHEGGNGISNLRGTIAMARTSDPNSATSQFYINHVDNPPLDYVSPQSPGYVAFGRVVEGMDAVDAIAQVETGAMDVPVQVVTIDDVRRAP